MEEKLDKLHEKIDSIAINVATNTADLKHHIQRTDLLQKQVDSVWPKVLMWLSIFAAIADLGHKVIN